MNVDRVIRFAFAGAVAFALIASCAQRAHAADFPTKLEIAYQVVAAVDALQTLDLRYSNCHEANPLLGAHPSDAKVLAFFAAGGGRARLCGCYPAPTLCSHLGVRLNRL